MIFVTCSLAFFLVRIHHVCESTVYVTDMPSVKIKLVVKFWGIQKLMWIFLLHGGSAVPNPRVLKVQLYLDQEAQNQK